MKHLFMSIGLDDLLIRSDGFGDLSILHDGVLRLRNLSLSLVERLPFDLPLSFKGGNNVLILPSDLKHKSSVLNLSEYF